ncbi:MAG: hypothetical protein ACKOSQ_02970 [Planctomycetaceae bacterium]
MPRITRFPWRPATAAIAVLLCCAGPAPSQPPGQRAPAHAAAVGTAGLWISDSPLDDGRRLVIIVDPATRHAAVYHVDAASGSMTLKSARDVSGDLALDEFNAQEPRPAAIRRMLQSAP